MEKIAHFFAEAIGFLTRLLEFAFYRCCKIITKFFPDWNESTSSDNTSYTPSAALILYIYTQSLFIQNIIVRLSKKSIVMLIEILLFVNDLSNK